MVAQRSAAAGALLLLLLAVLEQPVSANRAGISGRSQGIACNACHSGGVAPVVFFDGPTFLMPQAVGDFTFTLRSNEPELQTHAGLNVSASGGSVQVVDGTVQRTRLLNGELTHRPLPALLRSIDQNNEVVWVFRWKAPATAGTYTLFGAGNSVDNLGSNSGDRSATATFDVTVGQVPPTITASPTPSFTPTPIASLTPTLTPTVTESPTPAPTKVCCGDHDGNGTVSIGEVQRCSNCFLGVLALDACPRCDRDRNGSVSIGEVQCAANSFLDPANCFRLTP